MALRMLLLACCLLAGTCLGAESALEMDGLKSKLMAAVHNRMHAAASARSDPNEVLSEVLDLLKSVETELDSESKLDEGREEKRKVECARNVTTYEEAVSKFQAALSELPTAESFQATMDQLHERLRDNVQQSTNKEAALRRSTSEIAKSQKGWTSRMADFGTRQEKHASAFKTLSVIEGKLSSEEDRVTNALKGTDSLTTATALIEVVRSAASARAGVAAMVTDKDMAQLAQFLTAGVEGPTGEGQHKKDLENLVKKLKTTLKASLGVLKDTWKRGKGLFTANVEHLQEEQNEIKAKIAALKTAKEELRKKVFSVGDMAAKTMNTRLSVNGRLNTTAVILDAIKLRCAMGLRTYEHQVAYRKAELGIVDQVKDYVNNEVKEHADLLNVVLAEKKHKAENRKKDEDDIELDEKKLKVSKEKAGELMKEKEANQELELKNKEGQEKLAAVASQAKAIQEEEVRERKTLQDTKIEAAKKEQDAELTERKGLSDLKAKEATEEGELKKKNAEEEAVLSRDLKKKDEEGTKGAKAKEQEMEQEKIQLEKDKLAPQGDVKTLHNRVVQLEDEVKKLKGHHDVLTAVNGGATGATGGAGGKAAISMNYDLSPELKAIKEHNKQ